MFDILYCLVRWIPVLPSYGDLATPDLHNKIPALKIFARGWVAQESICLHYQR